MLQCALIHVDVVCRRSCASLVTHQIDEIAAQSEDSDTLCPDSLQEAAVNDIHEHHEVPECGTFTAYSDGSVHVVFHDRALLYLKPSREHCEVITPDGHRITVATATPLGVQQYVAQAMEFADWAFCSPSERAAVLQQAAKIQTELGKCRRAAALCEWAQGQLMSGQSHHHMSDVYKPDWCDDNIAAPNKRISSDVGAYIEGVATTEHATPTEREQMIQALLSKSSHLLNSLS